MSTKSRLRGKWRRWTPQVVSVFVAVGAVSSIAVGRVPGSRVAIAREAKSQEHRLANPSPGLLCRGGLDYPVDVQLIPDAVITTAGREAVEYHAEINLHRGSTAGIAWEAIVVDDSGQVIVPNLAKGTAQAKAGATTVTGSLLASQLPDGYYQVRVRVAVSLDNEPSTVMEAIRPVKIDGGKWREMDDSQWRSESRAHLAATVSPSATKGAQ